MTRPYFLFFLTIFLLFFTNCKQTTSLNKAQRLQLILDENVAPHSRIPGLSAHIEAPKQALSWTGAAGVATTGGTNKVGVNQPYRIASITKTFVAASILRLHEDGLLNIDESIGKYISSKHIDILEQDLYDLDNITIRHCLNHTSGLFDFAVGNETYKNLALKDADHRWTRTEQVQGAVDWGEPQGYPGEVYHYSDTGYILLGEIIENITGKNLAEAVRALIGFEALGLTHTWWEILEPTPPNFMPMVSRYAGRKDITKWDASLDLYGGGGIMSTSKDIAIFYYALFNDKIFKNPTTLQTMLSQPSFKKGYTPYKDYRLGLYKITIFGMEAFMHSGIWGTQVMYIPKLDAAISVNHTNNGRYYVIKQLAHVLME